VTLTMTLETKVAAEQRQAV